MLPKFEYAHLYKFLVSVGLLLLGLSIALPWLILRESGPLLIPEDDLKQLTGLAQRAIRRKQHDHFWMVRNYRWASLVFAGLGTIVSGVGLFMWGRRQAVLNRREDNEARKSDLELQSMTGSELERSREEEAKKTLEAGATDKRVDLRSMRDELVGIESLVFARFYEAFSGTYELFPNLTLSNGRRLDLFLASNLLDQPDYVVEVKYVRFINGLANRIIEAFHQLRIARQAFWNRKTRTLGLALLVVPDESDVSEITARVTRLARPIPSSMGVLVVQKTSLLTVPAAELRRWVEGAFATPDDEVEQDD